MDYVVLMKSGLTTEKAVINMKLSNSPRTGVERCQNLQQMWKQEQMRSVKEFLQWCIKKGVVPTL